MSPPEVREGRAAPPHEEPSLGDLLSEVASDVSALVRKELELARVELTEEARKAGKAGGMLAATGLLAHLALLLLAFAAAWGLDEVMPAGLAFLIVGVVVGLVAAGLYEQSRSRLRTLRPAPEQTIETMKEDVQWVRQQRS